MLRGVNQACVCALNQLNRAFYAAIAREWSDTRKAPWDGFGRVISCLPHPARGERTPLRVLDVGAGDGRFAAYLARQQLPALDYLGVDLSTALLDHARARGLGPAYRFEQLDVVEGDAQRSLPSGEHALIVLFGVLHHLPSLALRRELLATLGARLAPGGVLAMTFWRLPEDARFARRVLSWESYNASAPQPLDLTQLEPGDTLLRWGRGTAPPRYCHFADAAEISELIACTGLRVLDRFRADGRGEQLNEYVLLTAAARDAPPCTPGERC